MTAGLMFFLLLVPMYMLLDALISRRQYALMARMAMATGVAYFVLAGMLLTILPALLKRYRPFNPRASFALSALIILINLVALFLFISMSA